MSKIISIIVSLFIAVIVFAVFLASGEIDKKISKNSIIMNEACENMLAVNKDIVSGFMNGETEISPDELTSAIKKSNQAFLEYKSSRDNIIIFENYNESIFNLDTLHDTLYNDKCKSYLSDQ